MPNTVVMAGRPVTSSQPSRAATGQVGDTGGEQGRMLPGAARERRLGDSEGARPVQPCRIVHGWRTPLLDDPHDRRRGRPSADGVTHAAAMMDPPRS